MILINFTTPPEEKERLSKKWKMLYERCMAKRDDKCVTGFVDHCLQEKPPKADVVGELLAYLKEQMVEMNKKRDKEMKGFLRWLGRLIGEDIDNLTNKTEVRAYDELTFKELFEILEKSGGKIKADLKDREFQETLEMEFDRSLKILKPLKARTKLTGDLIDKIVYKLYGLMDKEEK